MGASPGALESGGIPAGFGEWGHLQVALESVGITRGFGDWGHLPVALESEGIYRWLWRVGASPGGFGE